MLNLVNDKLFSIQYHGFNQGYYLGDERFYPMIHGEGNIELIDLSKEIEIKKIALTTKQKNKHLLWLFPSMGFTQLDEKINSYIESILALQSMSFGIAFDVTLPPFEEKKLLEYRNALLASFRAIASDLPENLMLFLRFDLTFIKDIHELFLFLKKDLFFPFQLICKHPQLSHYPYALDYIGWDFPACVGTMNSLKKMESRHLPNGFLLPEDLKGKRLPVELIEKKMMRIIPCTQLTELWEGMDDLYLYSDCLNSISKRKVAGFEAAGGKIHLLD